MTTEIKCTCDQAERRSRWEREHWGGPTPAHAELCPVRRQNREFRERFDAAREQDGRGYILLDGYPHAVRVAPNGQPRNQSFLDLSKRIWTVYQTEQEAWDAQHIIEENCVHSWEVVSHEERRCPLCHAIEVFPDI